MKIVSFDNSLILWRIYNPVEHLGWSCFTELVNGFQLLIIFAKKPIATVRLGSEYAPAIINLISTSAAQLYSKTTKINVIFTGTLYFFLKLVQKDKFMSNESHTQAFWLAPNLDLYLTNLYTRNLYLTHLRRIQNTLEPL